MVWERIKIRENNSFVGDSGDIDIQIPNNRPISALMLVVRDKNGSSSNCVDAGTLQTVVESITKIKVEADAREIKDYSGQVCRDFATYRDGRMPPFTNTQVAGSTYPTGWNEAVFPINFGRFPSDRQVFLAAPLYDPLYLKMSYDFTISSTAGFVSGYAKYDLYADVMPKMDPAALKTTKVLEETLKQQHTTISSGIEPVPITLDPTRRLRQLLVRCYETGVAEGVDITKLSLDIDSKEIVTDDWNRWQWQNALDSRLKYEQVAHMVATADQDNNPDVIYTGIPNVEPLISPISAGTEDIYVTTTGDQVTVAGAASGEEYRLIMHSPVIPACVFLDFDRNLSMSNMINQGSRDIQLNMTQGAAGGAVEVYEQSIAPAVEE